jgi:hypothetical protein
MPIFRASYWPRMLRANLKLSPMGFKLSPAQVGVVTLIRNKIKFSSYISKIRGIGCEVIWLKASSYLGKNLSISPYILGSPSSYSIWHCTRSHLNFLTYEESFVYFFINAFIEELIEDEEKGGWSSLTILTRKDAHGLVIIAPVPSPHSRESFSELVNNFKEANKKLIIV